MLNLLTILKNLIILMYLFKLNSMEKLFKKETKNNILRKNSNFSSNQCSSPLIKFSHKLKFFAI